MNQPSQGPVSNGPSTKLSELERYRLFFAAITDYAIYMLSPEGFVTSWNAGAVRFKGYTEQEIVGEHFSRFYTEEDQAAGVPARALQTAREQGKFEAEGWRVRKDGARFWASVVIDPIRDADGHLVGYAKITRDITDRRQVEEALRASEERFRMLVQGVTDYAIYMLSPDGEITNWNAGAQYIKGYTQEEVLGSHFSRFYTDEDRAGGMPTTALETAAKEGRFEAEGWRVRKDGTRFWANVIIDAIRNEMGELVGYAKVTRDITERRNAAEMLDRAKDALFQSQKLEAIGKLTGGVAHDFNNLLAVIVSGLEIISERLHHPADLKLLESMQRSALRGATLTQQLLMFARQQPLRHDKVNINEVINDFKTVLHRLCSSAISFNTTLAAVSDAVLIDDAQFEAALLNLVANSRDAMPAGGTITISTENVELSKNQLGSLSAGRFIKVTVADTGEGMPPEVASRAVDPFFTTKPLGKGTGMGLSQVYGFIQQTKGEMVIDTLVSKGTSISLYLPLFASANDEPSSDGAGTERAARQDKVLVVDDEPDVLNVSAQLFGVLGYEVLTASNGSDALDILERTPDVAVLFTDVMMPGMTGIELARKAHALNPAIRVLLVSGYALPALKEGGAEVDDFELVKKPFRKAELLTRLRKAS
jgi:PAS domain S-box-containing protein